MNKSLCEQNSRDLYRGRPEQVDPYASPRVIKAHSKSLVDLQAKDNPCSEFMKNFNTYQYDGICHRHLPLSPPRAVLVVGAVMPYPRHLTLHLLYAYNWSGGCELFECSHE